MEKEVIKNQVEEPAKYEKPTLEHFGPWMITTEVTPMSFPPVAP